MPEAARRSPIAVVALGVTLFSTGPVMVASASISGVAFSFWRLWFGVVILGVAAVVHRLVTGTAVGPRGWWWAGGCGLAFAVHQLMFMSALRVVPVVDVTLMNTLAPVVVGVLALPAFGERPGVPFRLWSLVAMAGAAAVALGGATGPDGDPWGMALAAGNVVFYAVFFVGSKLARPHIEPVPFLWGVALASAVVVSTFAVGTGTALGPVTTRDLALALAVAVLPGALGHFSVTWALRWVPANLPPVMMLAIPVLSGAMAWVAVDQPVRGAQVAAGVVTLVGVAGAVRAPSAPRLAADEALVLAEST